MLTIGITGKLGSGKSTVCRALAARGAQVVDADAIARELLAPASPLAAQVLDTFGPAVRAADGSLDRRALARQVFASETSRRQLEALVHPRIRAEVLRRRARSSSRIVVIEVPLLDGPRKTEYALDAVIVVEAPTATAVARAVSRGMDEQDVRARLRAQPSDEERRSLADLHLDNSGSTEELEEAVDELWDWLMKRADDT